MLADHWDSGLLVGDGVEVTWEQGVAVIFPGRVQRDEVAHLPSLLPVGRNALNFLVYLGILFPGGLI